MTATILHTIDTTGPGGAETVFVELADRLRRMGFESATAITGEGWVADALRRRGLDPILLTTGGRGFDLAYLRGLMRAIRGCRADLVQSHLFGTNVYGSLAGLFLRRPVVATFHGQADVAPEERFVGLKSAILRRGASSLVAVSERLGGDVLARLQVPRSRLRTIHNGVVLSEDAAPHRAARRGEWGVRPEQILVGAIGNIRRSKDYATLLRAAACLERDQAGRFRFVVAGQPDRQGLYESLLELRRELGLEDAVRFVGFREDIPAILASLDIFALSSTDEGFSIATVEAMAAGLPVVATRSGGPEEIVADRVDGILVEPRKPEMLAREIRSLADDSERRTAIGQRARDTARRRFAVEAMVAAYADLYRELLARR